MMHTNNPTLVNLEGMAQTPAFQRALIYIAGVKVAKYDRYCSSYEEVVYAYCIKDGNGKVLKRETRDKFNTYRGDLTEAARHIADKLRRRNITRYAVVSDESANQVLQHIKGHYSFTTSMGIVDGLDETMKYDLFLNAYQQYVLRKTIDERMADPSNDKGYWEYLEEMYPSVCEEMRAADARRIKEKINRQSW